MAVNAPPQYHKAELAYRQAQTLADQISCLEEMLALLPKHKASEKVEADLKSRLKEARADLAAEKAAPKKGKTYRFPRQGAGQVVILGAPNSGKSRVLKELTNAQPEVAPYPFTTREPLPGMMPWEDVVVQLIDMPPITDTMFEVYIPNIVRSTDAALLCFDGSSDDAPDETQEVLKQLAQRKSILAAQSGFVEDNFSLVQIRTLLVVTRGDDPGAAERLAYFDEMYPTPLERLVVELDRPDSLAELRNRIYGLLGLLRAYTKAPGKPADFKSPFTLPMGATVEDLAGKVHKDLAAAVKFAKVWHHGQSDLATAGRDFVLQDKDLVELHT